jgi:hypothetical protein
MAATRLSRLQKRLLAWLSHDDQRTQGRMSSSHYARVRAFSSEKSNISHSLHTLEGRGVLVIGRSPGGKAEDVFLTAAGHHQATRLATESLSKGKSQLTSPVPVEYV